MAATHASGSVTIAAAGSAFDAASGDLNGLFGTGDTPKFTLNDGQGTSLDFFIDEQPLRILTSSQHSSTAHDPFSGSISVPTAKVDGAAQRSQLVLKSDVTAWGLHGHQGLALVVTDVTGSTVKIEFDTQGNHVTGSPDSVIGTSGSFTSKNYVVKYADDHYMLHFKTSGQSNSTSNLLLYWAMKDAFDNGFGIEPFQLTNNNGTTNQPAAGSSSGTALGVVLQSTTHGNVGNICKVSVSGSGNTTFQNTTVKELGIGGYFAPFPNFTEANLPTVSGGDKYFRGGTIGGGAGSLSTAEIAQAIVDIVNGTAGNPLLDMTAQRSSAVANLTAGTGGTGGNQTITAANNTDLFTVSGMTGGAAAAGGGGTQRMARTKIDGRQISVGGVKRDNLASGSVEIAHLNFVASEGASAFGGALNDADIIALHDSSTDSVKGVNLEHIRDFINSGSLGGTSGSLLFNDDGQTGGILDFKTDGLSLTASNGRKILFTGPGASPSGSNIQLYSPSKGEFSIVAHGPGSGVNSQIYLFARGKGAGTPACYINIGSGSNREIEYAAGNASSTSGHQFIMKSNTHLLTLHSNAGTAAPFIQSETPGMFFNLKEAPTSTIRTAMTLTSSSPHKQDGFDGNTNNAYALVLGASDGTNLTSSALAFRSVTSSVIYDAGTPDLPVLTIKSKGANNTRGAVHIDGAEVVIGNAGSRRFTFASKSGVGIIGHGKSGVAVSTSGAFIDGDGRGSIRFDTNNSHDTVTIFSGSTAIFGGRNADMQIRNAASKIWLGGGTTYYIGGAANAVGYFHTVSASVGKINSLEVEELVSRTVTKDSLEIKDNLVIAAVSGAAPGDHVGAGFQVGGVVGVSGTGSAPLMSLTLGTRKVTGDAAVVNVDGQAGASFMSGGVTQAMLGTPGMRFGVTGSVSGSLLQGKRAEIGHISVGKVSGVSLVGSTSVSGATGNFHDLTGDDCVFGGVQVSSVTASNGVILGSANTDDLSFLGGQITDLVPQNDNKVALGSATKRYTLISAMSASIAGNVGIVGTATAGGVTSAGTISGSTVNAATLNVGLKATVPHLDVNDSLEVAGYAGFAGTVAVSGTLSGATISGSAGTFHEVTVNKLHGLGIVTQDNLQTGSVLTAAILDSAVTTAKINDNAVTAAKIGALAVTKAKLNQDIVINHSDANGGLTFTSGRLSVGFRKDVFVRSDGSNISGTIPTHGMFATKAVPTPYTTASLGAQPQSGSLMVYLNGVLLHGDYVGDEQGAGRNPGSADYHLLTGSANAYKVLLHQDLALDSDDILTITYLSGSGTNE